MTSAETPTIEGNLGLVRAVARTYSGSGVAFADLVQEGTIGLMRAVERFDRCRGVKFSTYAMWWIRRSMRDAIAASNPIRIPPQAKRQLAAVHHAETELQRHDPRRASDAEIAELAELSVNAVRSLRSAPQVTASLDQPVGDDTTPLGDLIADPRARRPIRERDRARATRQRLGDVAAAAETPPRGDRPALRPQRRLRPEPRGDRATAGGRR
jgi:RNA polymerase primary sigma factor